MDNLYDFNSNSNHAKFFEWIWGVVPSIKFKTMCPYFWSYVLTIIFLPVILVYKFIEALFRPWMNYLDEKGERDAQLYVDKLIAEIEAGITSEDFYKIYESKCFKKYGFQNDENGIAYLSTDLYDKVYMKYVSYRADRKIKKQQKQQQIDNFKYGSTGTFLTYVMGAIGLALVAWFFYWFVHLFTWAEFVEFLIKLGLFLVGCATLFGVAWGLASVLKRFGCDTWIRNIVFWRYIGQFFVMIWKGIKIFFDMIGNLYRKSCPTIHWD
jgi:hypothetical protein